MRIHRKEEQEKRAAENSGDLQRVPFEYSAEYLKAHVCNKTTSGWGKNYLKA